VVFDEAGMEATRRCVEDWMDQCHAQAAQGRGWLHAPFRPELRRGYDEGEGSAGEVSEAPRQRRSVTRSATAFPVQVDHLRPKDPR